MWVAWNVPVLSDGIRLFMGGPEIAEVPSLVPKNGFPSHGGIAQAPTADTAIPTAIDTTATAKYPRLMQASPHRTADPAAGSSGPFFEERREDSSWSPCLIPGTDGSPFSTDNRVVEIDPNVRTYYDKGEESARLSGGFPSGPLELVRTQEIVLRHLPEAPLEILDVGGGPGVYAAWLADLGHRVHVVDPIRLHVEQAAASHPEVTAELGEARVLRSPDTSVDAVLLMGPLYHLVERADRLRALHEARRVLRPGGLLFAAAISRFAAMLDLLIRLDRLHEPNVLGLVEEAVETGVFGGPGRGELFTTSYFHLPRELAAEIEAAGFTLDEVTPVEGPAGVIPDFAERWADPDRRAAILAAARLGEGDPEMAAATGHLLATAHRPI
jgi:SAM-dependent methyltransferase